MRYELIVEVSRPNGTLQRIQVFPKTDSEIVASNEPLNCKKTETVPMETCFGYRHVMLTTEFNVTTSPSVGLSTKMIRFVGAGDGIGLGNDDGTTVGADEIVGMVVGKGDEDGAGDGIDVGARDDDTVKKGDVPSRRDGMLYTRIW